MPIRFLDLFAGAGGLSEGFIQEGYIPVAHVEMDKAACYTLRTRVAYHYLENSVEGRQIYKNYLKGKLSRSEFYTRVPSHLMDSVIEETIGAETIDSIFERIDGLNGDKAIDLIVGGPPCQAYSLVGRSRVGESIRDDARNYLFEYYVRFLKRYNPKYFVFENVTGLFSARDKSGKGFFLQVMSAFKKAGYQVFQHVVNAEELGIPQKRRRVILIGCRMADAACGDIELPILPQCPVTINQIWQDLKKIQAGEGSIRGTGRQRKNVHPWLYDVHIADDEYPVTYHQARPVNEHDKDIYRRVVAMWSEGRRFNYATDLPADMQTHKNLKSFVDRFKVVDGAAHASHTVVAHMSRDGHYYIHPDITQNRSLSPREAARLQTFPDNYFFESATEKDSRAGAFRQIGNAVPVMLARLIAANLKAKF